MQETGIGTLPDGREVRAVTLDNGRLRAVLWDYGARLNDLRLKGHDLPLVLGGAGPAAYGGVLDMFGAVMGPVANRIRGAAFEIDGTRHGIEANQDGRHALHCGAAGLHLLTWDIASVSEEAVTFTADLADGAGGLPGRRRIAVRYALDGATLRLEMTAETDRASPINLAHHPFWTMQAPDSWSGERLWVGAERYLPVDGDVIPTGEIAPVADTAFDFRRPVRLDPAGLPPIDHNFCLASGPRALTAVCRLDSPRTGLALEIATTAPGLQVFDMRPLSVEGEQTLHGRPYPPMAGLAIEPQMWPDAPGRPDWPDIVLRPGKTFRQVTEYRLASGAGE